MRKRNLIFVIGSILIFLLFSCSDDESDPTNPQTDYMQYEGLSGEIGSPGGIIEVNDSESPIYGTTIEIPENALTQTVNITVSATEAPDLFSSNEHDVAIKLEPEGLIFDEPVKITMPYSSTIDETDIKVFYFNLSDSSMSEVQINQVYSEENMVSFYTDHFSTYFTTGNSLNICSGEAPNETNVLNALADFSFNSSTLATYEEAERILKHLCPLVSIYPSDQYSATGRFPSGYYITLWVGTYGKTDRYGVRYGTDEDLSFWGSNDTYFEIVKSLDLNLNGTWEAIEYIDKLGRDMLNGFSFTQQQTLCDGNCTFDFTFYAKYENFQVTFNEMNVTINYYITIDYPGYNCNPCELFVADGEWDTTDQDIRYATCSYETSIMSLVNFILAYGGELYYPTIMEYTGDYLYLKEGTAELKLQKVN